MYIKPSFAILLVAQAILAVCLFAVMVYNFRNSKSKFVYTISGMMLISTLFGLYSEYARKQYNNRITEPPTEYKPYLYAVTLSMIISESLFSVSHWVLAEKYYTVSIEMPYVIHEVNVPKRKYCSRIALNWTMITLNVGSAFYPIPFWYTTNLMNHEKDVSKAWKIFSLIYYFPSIIFMLISGLVLLNSVRKIRSFLQESDQSINTKNMWLHVSSFGLFTASLLINGFSRIDA